jgi:hypothetical protein
MPKSLGFQSDLITSTGSVHLVPSSSLALTKILEDMILNM